MTGWEQADGAEDGLETAKKMGILAEIVQKRDDARVKDPAWQLPIPIHTSLMVEAFSYGILSADFWFKGYRVPPHLDLVLNWIAFNVQREFPETFANISLNEYVARVEEWMAEAPWVKEWNENPRVNNAEQRLYLILRDAEAIKKMSNRPFVCLRSVALNAAHLIDREWQQRLEFNQYINSQPFQVEETNTNANPKAK